MGKKEAQIINFEQGASDVFEQKYYPKVAELLLELDRISKIQRNKKDFFYLNAEMQKKARRAESIKKGFMTKPHEKILKIKKIIEELEELIKAYSKTTK